MVEAKENSIRTTWWMDIYDNDSESNECEKNDGDYLSSVSDYTGKFGGDFRRTNCLNAIW